MAVRSAIPPIDDEGFKIASRQVASPVGIVTAASGGQRDGITSISITSVTVEPPMILVCINREAPIEDLIARSGAFAVSFLSQEQHHLARVFSAPAEAARDRFSEGSWNRMVTGAPVLEGCVTAFDCELDNTISTGTHNVHFGRIVGVSTERQDVLLYCDGLLRRLQPLE